MPSCCEVVLFVRRVRWRWAPSVQGSKRSKGSRGCWRGFAGCEGKRWSLRWGRGAGRVSRPPGMAGEATLSWSAARRDPGRVSRPLSSCDCPGRTPPQRGIIQITGKYNVISIQYHPFTREGQRHDVYARIASCEDRIASGRGRVPRVAFLVRPRCYDHRPMCSKDARG